MNERVIFYGRVLSELIQDRKASILVCGGGSVDKKVLQESGFNKVTISNLHEKVDGNEYAPFKWKYENAESLSFEDESFDYVITHAAIHHASSPHRVLTEMYRVAKKGVLAFEARDSITMSILVKFRFADTYEQAAVYYNDCKSGGVNDSDIPNYIYRWTEREVEKTINSYAPHVRHRFCYRYGTALTGTNELEKKGSIKYILLKAVRPLHWLFTRLFPRQQNLFAFHIEKPTLPDALLPWLKWNDGEIYFSKEWGEQKYNCPSG